MKVASGLVSGPHPAPELAQAAVAMALAEAGLSRADQVILFLSRDFIRHAQPAVVAAARAAGTLAVSGSTASGLFTERGWQLDQPAAAALVYAATNAECTSDSPLLSFSGQAVLPYDWRQGSPRAGLIDADAVAWAHGRSSDNACAEARLPGVSARLAHALGWRRLGEAQTVEQCRGLDLCRLGGQSAADSLSRALPAALRDKPPVHQIVAIRDPAAPAIALLSRNADGSLTLAESLAEGEQLTWAIRQPLAAEQEMRETLKAAVNPKNSPNFALMFSCIGRGPLFYGDDDRDLLAFRERFPNTPLLGAYGTGQIVPLADGNQLFQNTALTLLFESTHV